jgi:Zn-dependent membrane protease YugP
MTHEQYDYTEDVARNNLRPEASRQALSMLENGLISAAPMVNPDALGETDHFWAAPSWIRLSQSFFEAEHPGDAAQTLGHELGHVIQRQVLGFTSGWDPP